MKQNWNLKQNWCRKNFDISYSRQISSKICLNDDQLPWCCPLLSWPHPLTDTNIHRPKGYSWYLHRQDLDSCLLFHEWDQGRLFFLVSLFLDPLLNTLGFSTSHCYCSKTAHPVGCMQPWIVLPSENSGSRTVYLYGAWRHRINSQFPAFVIKCSLLSEDMGSELPATAQQVEVRQKKITQCPKHSFALLSPLPIHREQKVQSIPQIWSWETAELGAKLSKRLGHQKEECVCWKDQTRESQGQVLEAPFLPGTVPQKQSRWGCLDLPTVIQPEIRLGGCFGSKVREI